MVATMKHRRTIPLEKFSILIGLKNGFMQMDEIVSRLMVSKALTSTKNALEYIPVLSHMEDHVMYRRYR